MFEKFNPLKEEESHEKPHEVSIKKVIDMNVDAAKKYLDQDDPLYKKLVDFYQNRPETKNELNYLFSKKSEQEIEDYFFGLKKFIDNKDRYIESRERFFEIDSVMKSRKKLGENPRIASQDEYRLGAFADYIESQVRDAVFLANKKGYKTFQSGYRERNHREQFLDVFNKNVNIPQSTIDELKEKAVDVKVDYQPDRTTIILSPISSNAIRLSEWKEVWNLLVESLPETDEQVVGVEEYDEQVSFRKQQDSLKA